MERGREGKKRDKSPFLLQRQREEDIIYLIHERCYGEGEGREMLQEKAELPGLQKSCIIEAKQ